MMRFKDYFLNKITEILGTFFCTFYYAGVFIYYWKYFQCDIFDRNSCYRYDNDEIFDGLV